MLQTLKDCGFALALDDFGTGYSSLAYIRDFPFDRLKIDRSFVHGLKNSERALAIIEAVANFGRILGKDVVAEGIETEQEMQAMQKVGCTHLQGYLFAKALPADKIEAMVALGRLAAIRNNEPVLAERARSRSGSSPGAAVAARPPDPPPPPAAVHPLPHHLSERARLTVPRSGPIPDGSAGADPGSLDRLHIPNSGDCHGRRERSRSRRQPAAGLCAAEGLDLGQGQRRPVRQYQPARSPARPIEKELPVGRHPLQLYSLGTPNGVKVTIMLEELLAAGHKGAEYDAWLIRIGEGDQFGSGFVADQSEQQDPGDAGPQRPTRRSGCSRAARSSSISPRSSAPSCRPSITRAPRRSTG